MLGSSLTHKYTHNGLTLLGRFFGKIRSRQIRSVLEIQLFVCLNLGVPVQPGCVENHYCESWLRLALCLRSSFYGHK